MTNKTRSVLYMLVSGLAFSLMGAMVKGAEGIPTFEKVFARNLVSLLIAWVAVRKSGVPLLGRPSNRKYLISRSLMGCVGVIFYFYAIDNLYLADAAMLNKISPFFVTLFAFIFLRERITKLQLPALLIVFIGAMLVVKPKFDLEVLPALAGFISAMGAGGAYTVLRFLRDKEEPATIVFFFSAFTVLAMIPLMLPVFVVPNPRQLLFLLSTGIFAAIGQFSLTLAYHLGRASEVSIYNYSSIIFSALLGYLFWGEVSDPLSMLGTVMVIGASVVVFLHGRQGASRKSG
jgi:drug/metabolite transporter (DMT)-like permease